MAQWRGIRNWPENSYLNTDDTLRIFGNLEFLMERTTRVIFNQEDKSKTTVMQSLKKDDLVYKEDFDWLFNMLNLFYNYYDQVGGGFQLPESNKKIINYTLMTTMERDMFLLRTYIMGGL